MSLLNLKKCISLLLIISLFACDKPDDINPPKENYIRSGSEYFPLKSALAMYYHLNSTLSYFVIELKGENDNLAHFAYLYVSKTSVLPEGNFTYLPPTTSPLFQLNKFYGTFWQYGTSTLDSDNLKSGNLQVQKIDGHYRIKGTVVKDNNESIEVSYKGPIEHAEGW